MVPKFGRFLALPNFRGRAFQKWHPHYHPSLVACGLEKLREGTPTSREVIWAHTLNFRPNFEFSRLQFLGTPVPLVVALTNLSKFLACVKI